MDPDLGQSEVGRSRADGPTITDIRRRLQALATYRDRLVRFARRRRANEHDAEDLAQLAIIRVATSATFNDRAGDPWPYLARTMANLVAELYRRKVFEEAKSYGLRVPRDRGLEQDVIDHEMATKALVRLIKTEPVLTVRLVAHRALGGATWKELGQEFDLTGTAARLRVSRALRRLRSRLERHHYEQDKES